MAYDWMSDSTSPYPTTYGGSTGYTGGYQTPTVPHTTAPTAPTGTTSPAPAPPGAGDFQPMAAGPYQAPSPPPVSESATAGGTPTGPTDPYAGVDAAYRQWLGRTGSPADYQSWVGNPNYQAGIQFSPEADGYKTVTNFQTQLAGLAGLDPTQRAARYDQLARDVASNLQAHGHTVKWNGDTLNVDGRDYKINTAAGGSGTSAQGAGGNPHSYFSSLTANLPPTPASLLSLEKQLNAQGIDVLRNAAGVAGKIRIRATGQIVDVIQSAGSGGKAWQWLTESGGGVAGQGGLQTYPGPKNAYGFGFEDLLGTGAVDPAMQARVLELLKNPFSLDDHTLDVMKAQAKNQAAEMGLSDTNQLEALGHSLGIDDSRYIESEKMAARRDRDSSILDANRDIDLRAAATRKQELHQAIQTAMQWAQQQTGRRASTAQMLEEIARQWSSLNADYGLSTEALRQSANRDAFGQYQWLNGG